MTFQAANRNLTEVSFAPIWPGRQQASSVLNYRSVLMPTQPEIAVALGAQIGPIILELGAGDSNLKI